MHALATKNVIFSESFDITRLPKSFCKIYKFSKTVRINFRLDGVLLH
jgi:hypothetical protein